MPSRKHFWNRGKGGQLKGKRKQGVRSEGNDVATCLMQMSIASGKRRW
ncbi:hypothetical protein PB70LOC_03323 [Pectobacterium versatile]|nr:Hypothetical protein SCC1_1252 [Pectobacterium versatile]POY57439.1 hypothetical protein PB70LOC_03323 [Pectobacterium versatile]GKV80032.1 hypothetical protein PEC106664_08060 [Pectobacterium carotovorum subsp. carotovorum]